MARNIGTSTANPHFIQLHKGIEAGAHVGNHGYFKTIVLPLGKCTH